MYFCFVEMARGEEGDGVRHIATRGGKSRPHAGWLSMGFIEKVCGQGLAGQISDARDAIRGIYNPWPAVVYLWRSWQSADT